MSSKVKNNFIFKVTALFLTLIMTAGSVVAVYADEADLEVTKASAKEASAEESRADSSGKKETASSGEAAKAGSEKSSTENTVKQEEKDKENDQAADKQKEAAASGEAVKAGSEKSSTENTAKQEEVKENDQTAEKQNEKASSGEEAKAAADEASAEDSSAEKDNTGKQEEESTESRQTAENQNEKASSGEEAKAAADETAAEEKSAENTGGPEETVTSQSAGKQTSDTSSAVTETEGSLLAGDGASGAVSEETGNDVAEPAVAAGSEQLVKKPALNEGYGVIYLPNGVKASFMREDGPDSWTGEEADYGYAIPVGSTIKLSMSTDASKCVFSVTMTDGTPVSISGDSFTMPGGRCRVSVQLFYSVNIDMTGDDVPDGTSVTVSGTTAVKGQSTSVLVKSGDTVQLSVNTAASEYDIAAVNTKSGGNVPISGNTFVMPEANVNLSVNFSYLLNMDLTAQDVPDGFYVTINGTKVSKGEKKSIKAAAGSTYRIEDIAAIKGVNYGTDKPSGTTQVKMRFSSGSSSSIVPVTDLQGSGYKMPSSNVDASLYVLYGWKTTFTGDLYTCSMQNLSDSDSPWYGHAGDRIRIDLDRSSCKAPIEVTVKDASGNTVAQDSVDSDSYIFNMPASVAYITIKGELEKAKYKVTISRTVHGSIMIDSSEQYERTVVRMKTVPDEGYAINPGGIAIAYKKGSRTYTIKPAPDKEDSSILTFTMPGADVTIGGVFVKPHVVSVTTNKGGKVTVDYRNPYGEYSSRGRDVYLKVTPKKGYVLKAWAARDTDGNVVEIDSEEGCITMPDADVAVAAVFAKKSTGSSGSGSGSSGYISSGSEPYYTDETMPDDDEEVDEDATPEELLDLVPLTSAIAANTVLAVVSGISMMLSM